MAGWGLSPVAWGPGRLTGGGCSNYAVLSAPKGACPPEDGGDCWVYTELKEIRSDPRHKRHGVYLWHHPIVATLHKGSATRGRSARSSWREPAWHWRASRQP